MLHTVVWLLIGWLYAPALLQLHGSAWRLIDYTHAYFVLPVAVWLAWRSRHQWGPLLEDTRPATKTVHLALFALGLLVWLFGQRFNYLAIVTASALPVLYGAIGFLYGGDIARALAFPIGYLALLVPPPMGLLDTVTLPMRHATSAASATLLGLVGYPVTRQGLLLAMGGHEIFMGVPCSGFRSLMALLCLGLVYVHLSGGSRAKKLWLAASIVPLALMGNLMRVIALCLITYHFGEEAGQGFFHNFSGLVVFVFLIAGLVVLQDVLSRIGRFSSRAEAPAEPAIGEPVA